MYDFRNIDGISMVIGQNLLDDNMTIITKGTF